MKIPSDFLSPLHSRARKWKMFYSTICLHTLNIVPQLFIFIVFGWTKSWQFIFPVCFLSCKLKILSSAKKVGRFCYFFVAFSDYMNFKGYCVARFLQIMFLFLNSLFYLKIKVKLKLTSKLENIFKWERFFVGPDATFLGPWELKAPLNVTWEDAIFGTWNNSHLHTYKFSFYTRDCC